MDERYGEQNWWPADTAFEVVLGAILTQNTNWNNVEQSIKNLKKEIILTPQNILNIEDEKLKDLIKPSGFYNQKAERLKIISSFIIEKLGCDIKNIKEYPLITGRRMLLNLKGVGEETADSILLYAADIPSFVIDKYTMRMFYRIGFDIDMKYRKYYEIFMDNLPHDVKLFKQYHALIVENSKLFCRKKAVCKGCPLERTCLKKY
ncbi:MAG: endonuclease [Calditerrivibrio sp.]|nr:endonuclease [Calditerrivibrio sp.]